MTVVQENSEKAVAAKPENAALESWWERRRTARREARRVRRVLYGFELWSVLKVSLLFYLCAWGVFLLAGVILWNVVNSQGYVERFENFILEIFNYETFTINGDELFRWYLWLGLFSVLVLTALTVVLCLLYNLISILVGGIRVTLIEEETVRLRPQSGAGQASRQAQQSFNNQTLISQPRQQNEDVMSQTMISPPAPSGAKELPFS